MCIKKLSTQGWTALLICLETNDSVVHFQCITVCGKSLTDMHLNRIVHKRLPPVNVGRKTVRGMLFSLNAHRLKMPGAAIHFQNLAVLNQHLGEVLLDRILLRHSQIPPFI